jgi:polar amino acid transport system substrate-binding protein
MLRAGLIAVLLLLLCGNAPVAAQPPPAPLKVAVFIAPPFVMKSAAGYTGFGWELWQQIAADLKVAYDTQEAGSVAQLLQLVREKRVDIAVANLSITAPRFEVMDFTQPWFDAGLRIMIDEDRHASMGNLMTDMRRSGHLRIYAWLAVIIVLGTIVLTLIDRKYHPEFPGTWREGLAESFYHVMSVATSGSTTHRNLFGAAGRLLGAVWLAFGVAVVAYVTSSITSVMTASQMTHQISSFGDLHGKHVGVMAGSVGETFSRTAMLDVQAFDTMEQAADALVQGRISAIVRDAPVLEWYDHAHPELPITVVGPVYNIEKYGFALPQNSPLTRPVSEAILRLQEKGGLDALRTRYFGTTR